MKKLIFVLLLAFCLCGCGKEYKDLAKNSGFEKCDGRDCLYYAPDTKAVYYLFNDYDGNQGFGYLAPYISENGKFCKWDDGKIIEIQ